MAYKKRVRMAKKDRVAQILRVAIELATEHGYDRITKDMIAKTIGCTPALVNVHYSTMNQLRKAIIRHAVKDEVLSIIAQGLAAGDPVAKSAPEALRSRAALSLV